MRIQRHKEMVQRALRATNTKVANGVKFAQWEDAHLNSDMESVIYCINLAKRIGTLGECGLMNRDSGDGWDG